MSLESRLMGRLLLPPGCVGTLGPWRSPLRKLLLGLTQAPLRRGRSWTMPSPSAVMRESTNYPKKRTFFRCMSTQILCCWETLSSSPSLSKERQTATPKTVTSRAPLNCRHTWAKTPPAWASFIRPRRGKVKVLEPWARRGIRVPTI